MLPFLLISFITTGLENTAAGMLLNCLIPFIFLFVVAAVALGIMVVLVYICIVVEGAGIGEALSSSWQLMRANAGTLIGATVLLTIISIGIGLVLFATQWLVSQLIFPTPFLATTVVDPPTSLQSFLLILLNLAYYLAASIVSVFYMGLWVQIYLKLRPKSVGEGEVQPAS